MPAGETEVATAWVLERFPHGLEETSLGDVTELAVYTDGAGEALVRGAFPDVRTSGVPDDWADRWKQFHRPVRAGGLWIGPPWIEPPAGEATVVVDPGRAFGTGAHATTRACIELLARIERGSLLDAGCGSGVVAVAAVRLGFAPVRAVDLDPVAVDVAVETARLNAVAVEVAQCDVLRDALSAAEAVVANIELAVVERLLARRPARVAVTSGYLASERPGAPGWEPADRLEVDGWAADVLVAE
ncbi:MAG TPA: 50S ribosomal protein L11 methyltransferase [Gaiellaceae bacterium]|nr:50S ribosomal protein L11 methyltransferase [Gaiellaceae bacterium]